MYHPSFSYFEQTAKSIFLIMTLLHSKLCNLPISLSVAYNLNTWAWYSKPCDQSAHTFLAFSPIASGSMMKPLLPPLPPRSPKHEQVCTPIFITPGQQCPQATLLCSDPSHFQRPAQALLPLWSLLFLQTQTTSPSIALSANHFDSLSSSSRVLFPHLSYLPHQPVHVLPAGCRPHPHLSLVCLTCGECIIKYVARI